MEIPTGLYPDNWELVEVAKQWQVEATHLGEGVISLCELTLDEEYMIGEDYEMIRLSIAETVRIFVTDPLLRFSLALSHDREKFPHPPLE